MSPRFKWKLPEGRLRSGSWLTLEEKRAADRLWRRIEAGESPGVVLWEVDGAFPPMSGCDGDAIEGELLRRLNCQAAPGRGFWREALQGPYPATDIFLALPGVQAPDNRPVPDEAGFMVYPDVEQPFVLSLDPEDGFPRPRTQLLAPSGTDRRLAPGFACKPDGTLCGILGGGHTSRPFRLAEDRHFEEAARMWIKAERPGPLHVLTMASLLSSPAFSTRPGRLKIGRHVLVYLLRKVRRKPWKDIAAACGASRSTCGDEYKRMRECLEIAVRDRCRELLEGTDFGCFADMYHHLESYIDELVERWWDTGSVVLRGSLRATRVR